MFGKLIKVFFKENFSFQRLLGSDPKKNKKKTFLIVLIMIYALGTTLFTFGIMFFKLGELLAPLNMINVLLIYAFIYGTGLSMMFVIFRANGYIFNYKDYELLEPLPIKNNVVIMAKTVVMLVFIYFGIFVFLSPIIFSYFYHGGFNFLSLIFIIIGFFTIPIIPTIVFSFISMLIARVTSKFRKNNIINIIVLFIVFLFIMYLSFSMTSLDGTNPLVNQTDFMEKIGGVYPPIKWFIDAISNHNFWSLLLLIGSNAVLLIGFIFGIQKLTLATNQRAMTKVTRKNNKAAISRSKSIIPAISAKESRTFFNTTIYALNIGFGPVILIVLSIASIFFSTKITDLLSTEFNLGVGAELIVLILISFCVSMVYSSAVSLSLEGKNFWILKSLPLEPKTIMHGKMLFNIILVLPAAIFALIIFKFTIGFSALTLIVMIIFTTTLSLTITVFGSLINLFVPKFEFRNPTEVVKQSAGALFGIFGSWFILILDGLIYYFTYDIVGSELSIILMSSFNLILFILGMIFINKKTESLFIKFEV